MRTFLFENRSTTEFKHLKLTEFAPGIDSEEHLQLLTEDAGEEFRSLWATFGPDGGRSVSQASTEEQNGTNNERIWKLEM